MPLSRESLALAGMLAVDGLEPFTYRVPIAVPNATPVGTQIGAATPLVMNQDSAFHCHCVRARLTSDAIGRVMTIDGDTGVDENGGWPDCPARIQIQDGGSDRFWQSDFIGASLIYPASGESMPTFRLPRYLAPKSVITVTAILTKLVGAASTIEVCFFGLKDYRKMPAVQLG